MGFSDFVVGMQLECMYMSLSYRVIEKYETFGFSGARSYEGRCF